MLIETLSLSLSFCLCINMICLVDIESSVLASMNLICVQPKLNQSSNLEGANKTFITIWAQIRKTKN